MHQGFLLRIRNRCVRLCIKLEENTKEWLQHHTILSAHKTPLQHRQQARLAQPQAKVEAGKEPLDRATTNTTHTQAGNSEVARTSVPPLKHLQETAQSE
jgi:hypothetical protein